MNKNKNPDFMWDKDSDRQLLRNLFPENSTSGTLAPYNQSRQSTSLDASASQVWETLRNPGKQSQENFCGKFTNNVYSEGIDYALLAEDLRMSSAKDEFLFDYRKYCRKDIETTTFNSSFGTPVTSSVDDNRGFRYMNESGKSVLGKFDIGLLNTRICYITQYKIQVHLTNKGFEYGILFHYKGTENEKLPDNAFTLETPADDSLSPASNFAIILKTRDFEVFNGFIKTVFNDANAKTCQKIVTSYVTYFLKKHDADIGKLMPIYETAPGFSLRGLSFETVIKHLQMLLDYDDDGVWSGWRDSSNAVINLLRNAASQKLYDWFHKNPAIILRIYRDLDGVQNKAIEGVSMSSKELFCLILTALSPKIEKAEKSFYIGKHFKVDSDINDQGINNWFNLGDDKTQLMLQQELVNPPNNIIPGDLVRYTLMPTVPIGEEQFFHPLDLVNLYDEESGGPIVFPAIYVKMLADREEWEHVIKIASIALMLAAIILSAGTLTPEASALLTVVTVVDIAATSIDIVLAMLPESDEKRWFEKYWRPISYAVAAGSFGVALREGLLRNGPRIMSDAVRQGSKAQEVIDFLRKSYAAVKIEMFVQGRLTFVALEPFTALVALLNNRICSQMERMGIFLSKEFDDGERLLIFAGYEYKGKLKDIKAFLRQAVQEKDAARTIAKLKAVIQATLKISDEGFELLEATIKESLTKWSNTTRPGAMGILEGTVKGEIIRCINFSGRAAQFKHHKLVEYWLAHPEEFVENGLELTKRVTHGQCVEPKNISEFLFEAERKLGMSENSLTFERAGELLFNARSHVRALRNSRHGPKLHNTFKPACDSCEPMLNSFNITQIFKKV